MKKITQILMLFLCFTNIVKAQDFAPGQQAQGLLESKNVTVDYSTGIFHYKVPLYTLKSGDFELPITLDYTGKGVKMDDRPGLLGYNWTLNTGGVVTRTVRGGIPDEKPIYGFLWTENASTSLRDDIIKVNQHERDGECDIFTALFGGNSVNFIIRKDGNNQIYAEPLERTNVRIECLQQTGTPKELIAGWIITDEDGNRFTYRQKEWTWDMNKEDAITINGIRDEDYLSSWYLSEIKPLNGNAIQFLYRPEKWENNEQAYLCENRYSLSYASNYQYGQAMREYPFDFRKYEGAFKEALDKAEQSVKYHADEILKSASYASFSWAHGWVQNPGYRQKMAEYQQHRRILGALSSFEQIHGASAALVDALENLEKTYSSTGASVYFAAAKNEVLDCLNEVQYVSEKVVGNFSYYRIQSPILERIVAPDSEVEFLYKGELDKLKMASANLYSCTDKKRFSQALFSGYYDTLEKISFFNRDSVEHRAVNFSYYNFVGEAFDTDPWGYATSFSFPDTERFILDTHPVYCKHLSLKTITTPDGGSIHLDYEPNRIFKTVNYDNHPTVLKLRYGGIRLSSIVTQAETDAPCDTISYIYPVSGTLVYDDYYNHEYLYYKDFKDGVISSKVKNRGVAFLNTGNNGMFYAHVIEHVSGKGSTSYLFHTPSLVNSYIVPYTFWMNALPLATAWYDENGNIKSLKKNIYYADMKNQGVLMGIAQVLQNKVFFADSDSLARYTKKILQLQSYEYYMNEEDLSKSYKGMPNINLGYGKMLDPYKDIYLYNISPRTTISIPNRLYNLCYGGTTLLKEQREYKFEGHVTDSISINDFYNLGQDTPYLLNEYDYDDLKQTVVPTRIKQTHRDGESYTLFQKNLASMDCSMEPVWKKMKEMNVLSPVVKSATLKNGHLLEETISRYDYLTVEDDSCIVLSGQYVYRPESTLEYEANQQVFSYTPSTYTRILDQKYGYIRGSYYPVDVSQRSEQTACVYSEVIHQPVLEAKNVLSESLAASDFAHLKDNPETMSILSRANYMFLMAKGFWNGYTQMNKEAHGTSFLEYTQTEAHARIVRLIEILATHDPNVNMEEIRCTLDSVKNQFDYINNFMKQYGPVVRSDANFELPGNTFTNWIQMFRTSSWVVPEIFEYSYWLGKNELCIENPEGAKWETVLLGYNGKLTCQIVCEQGVVTQELLPFSDASSLLSSYRLDLSAYTHVKSIKIALPSGTDYGLLVPEGTDYEASSYNSDGTIRARFNQSGTLELYEYDASHRIVCVKDRHGNIVNEYEYNHLINQ